MFVVHSTKALFLTCFLGITVLASAAEEALKPWDEYHVIMWVSDIAYKKPEKIPLFFQRLREMGVNAATAHNDGRFQPLVENHFPFYVENMVNRGLCLKFHSKVTDWDKFITNWRNTGRPESAFIRDYCLDDPKWRAMARKDVQSLVKTYLPHAPFAYDIRDELSTTISTNPFDYDFNPITLAKFREWLRTQYKDLPALNQEWETKFTSWDGVKPFSTDQIKNRMASGEALPRGTPDWPTVQRLKFDPKVAQQNATRWNFAPWADFRTYMDISLASALEDLRRSARNLDPRTPVGIEGTQMPSAFGGYDLWRLSQVLDWVEPYDIGSAREILGSFMAGKPLMTTVFEKETNAARRRLWHLLLEGDRGCLVWWSEDCIDWKSDDYALTAKAKALTPVFKEMTSPLAQVFMRAQPIRDPIAIHYSQASIQTDWLIESTRDGASWIRRFSSAEADYNHQAKVRGSWLKLFQDLGFSPTFISSQQVETDALAEIKVLVLPESFAVSDAEAIQFKKHLAQPDKWIVADGSPGLFDQHGRIRKDPALKEHFSAARSQERSFAVGGQKSDARDGDIALYAKQRLAPAPDFAWANWVREQTGLHPEVQVPLESRTRVHRFRLGKARLVAFERNITYQMSEDLKQAGGNETLEHPIELDARLSAPAHIYDLRTQKHLGRSDRIHFILDPWQPSTFALLEQEVAEADLLKALLR
jgi:hypothetical protein